MGLDWCLTPRIRDRALYDALVARLEALETDLQADHADPSATAVLEAEMDLARVQLSTITVSPEEAVGTHRLGDSPETVAYGFAIWQSHRDAAAQSGQRNPAPPAGPTVGFLDFVRLYQRRNAVASLQAFLDDRVVALTDPQRHAVFGADAEALERDGGDRDRVALLRMQRRTLEIRANEDPDAPRLLDSPDTVLVAHQLWREATAAGMDLLPPDMRVPDGGFPGFAVWALRNWATLLPDFGDEDREGAARSNQSPFAALAGHHAFRGKRVQYCDLLPEALRDAAFQDRSPEAMLTYADALEPYAKQYEAGAEYRRMAALGDRLAQFLEAEAQTYNPAAVADLRQRFGIPDDAPPESYWDYRTIVEAVEWLRFWGSRGLGLHAWY